LLLADIKAKQKDKTDQRKKEKDRQKEGRTEKREKTGIMPNRTKKKSKKSNGESKIKWDWRRT